MIASRLITLVAALSLAWLPRAAISADHAALAEAAGDLHVREAAYYHYQENYFPAIVRLLAADRRVTAPADRGESALLLGRLYHAYGQDNDAARTVQDLLADDAGREIHDQGWFLLARILSGRGHIKESLEALDRIDGALPDALETGRRSLEAALHTRSGAYELAAEVIRDWPVEDPSQRYAKFNLGVSMARSGDLRGGASLLADLGRMTPDDDEWHSLRDKANLALGYAYLRNGLPNLAREPFSRVRLKGPFSNQALLGVGWADAEDLGYRSALVPWMELRNRDSFDPAVQDSLLAVPYAMLRLDALNEAADHYTFAVERFGEATSLIDAALEYVQGGRMVTSLMQRTEPGAIAEQPEWRVLAPIVATADFQAALGRLQDLHVLDRNLADWQRSIDVFRAMLQQRELEHRRQSSILEVSLPQSRFADLVGRKHAFDIHLEQIEESGDSLALATPREFGQWGRITDARDQPSVSAAIAEAEETREKLGILGGVIQWTLDMEFETRLSRARDALSQADAWLADALLLRQQIEEKLNLERQLIADLTLRIDVAKPQVDSLRARLEETMSWQRAIVESMAATQLHAERARLDEFAAQARFALAAIYDMASNKNRMGEVSP